MSDLDIEEILANVGKAAFDMDSTELYNYFHEIVPTLCEEVRRLREELQRANDPEADNTPAEHPAFSRGQDDGVRGACARIRESLLADKAGIMSEPIESVCLDVERLRQERDALKGVVRTLMGELALSIPIYHSCHTALSTIAGWMPRWQDCQDIRCVSARAALEAASRSGGGKCADTNK
ncbi:MAG: hypothetical protein U1E51_06680 [Candidatus Binatia bacterium]|nr:hypothetical protein [Candidatus Binatia bacterium]